MMKLSDLIIKSFVDLHVNSAFSVTGGASMHLNDSAGENSGIKIMYMHNEQSCAMAAEGYARIARKPALVIVTAGPGAINAINGVFGAFTDSIPMIVLSGQAKKNTQISNYGLKHLRQLGDQEAPILEMVSRVTKKTYEVTSEMTGQEIAVLISDAFLMATTGRPGPVWIEVPVDVQALIVEDAEIPVEKPVNFELISESSKKSIQSLMNRLVDAKRPVFVLGSGVQISDTSRNAIALAQKFDVPILTAWSHDVIASDHPLFFGRPGTIGTRPGNMILQNSDLLVVLGSRLNIRQISYNYADFAPNAYKIQVDIDKAEFAKPFPKMDLYIESDLRQFFEFTETNTVSTELTNKRHFWLEWCREVNQKYSVKDSDYPKKLDSINAYHLIPEVIQQCGENAIVVCGDATACIVPFQTAALKEGMRMFSNSGCASMGYDLPAALGAAFADPNRPVICFAGDGSLMMNIQELQTLFASNLNILLIILDNGGYLSIKQTQGNFFGRFHGSDPNSGISFPNFTKVAQAFELPTLELDPVKWTREVREFLKLAGPRVMVAKLDPDQEFEPRLKSKMIAGRIQTPSLEDMYPHLDPNELSQCMSQGLRS
jgi:acetolactate synthase-1/2/3 large subunit